MNNEIIFRLISIYIIKYEIANNVDDIININLKYIHSLQFNKCFKQIINYPDHEYDSVSEWGSDDENIDNIYLI
jgi:hypothetical protein